jgi:hypothetical protein
LQSTHLEVAPAAGSNRHVLLPHNVLVHQQLLNDNPMSVREVVLFAEAEAAAVGGKNAGRRPALT